MTKSVSESSSPPSLPPLIEGLRSSWETHNIAALTALFDDDFEYVINGGDRFADKKQLRNYWCKNKLRQQGLKLLVYAPFKSGKKSGASFTASFYHPVRLSQTIVAGSFVVEATPDGKRIKKVLDNYDKIEWFDPFHSFRVFYRLTIAPVLRRVKLFFAPVASTLKALAKGALITALVFGILAVVYANFVYQILPLITPKQLEDLKEFTLIWFAAAYVIQQAAPFLRSTITPEMSVKSFDGQKDLTYMAALMEKADSVKIVSGDFSFIDSNKRLEACLRDLAFARKLTLISYKSQNIVEEEMATKTSSNDILIKLKDEGAIFFDFPVKAKITLVDHGGDRKMLFRFSKDVDGKSKLHMGFIKQTENSRALLAVIDDFLRTVR